MLGIVGKERRLDLAGVRRANVAITAVYRNMKTFDDFVIGDTELHVMHGSKNDLKAGAAFRAQVATKQPDGSYTASAISVGRDGARPF
jgi:hypothetical protein